MSEISASEVLAHVHNIDDATVAEIIATGVTEEQLKLACTIFARDKKAHSPSEIPAGPVGDALEILERVGAKLRGSYFGEGGSTMA
jgi:hypothetical protein